MVRVVHNEFHTRGNLADLPDKQFVSVPFVQVRHMTFKIRIRDVGKIAHDADGSDSSENRNVTISIPDSYKDKDVEIIYTLDGSQPEITFNKTDFQASKTKWGLDNINSITIAAYVDYGTAILYEENQKITLSETTTINAIAFYVDKIKQTCTKRCDWARNDYSIKKKLCFVLFLM